MILLSAGKNRFLLVDLCLSSIVQRNLVFFRSGKAVAMYEFDRTDLGIVNLLLEDGRMSASEIARCRLFSGAERLAS
ncbi:MAG: hypothetical protein B6D38_01015 [Anaerolineae bacterium UTCFX1]|nr:MAG: hypothetical protein B6D38_01015 [Anaerolineae bacterium UTCFX1]